VDGSECLGDYHSWRCDSRSAQNERHLHQWRYGQEVSLQVEREYRLHQHETGPTERELHCAVYLYK